MPGRDHGKTHIIQFPYVINGTPNMNGTYIIYLVQVRS